MTSSGVAIRNAESSDAAAVADLTKQLGYEVDASSVSERLTRLLSRNDQRFLVAELAGDVVGWVHIGIIEYIETDPFAVVGGLVVDRARRKHGVGRALMAAAEQWARDQDCVIMRLWSSAMRTEAHRFYEHLGYANIKTQYTFVKAIRPGGEHAIRGFIPRGEDG